MAANRKNDPAQLLGLEHGQRAGWVGLPANLGILTLARAFARCELCLRGRDLSDQPFDMIHIFTASHAVLETELPDARKRLAPEGKIWVSWPQETAALPTDLTESNLRTLAAEVQLAAAAPVMLDNIWMAQRLTLPQSP